MTYGPLISARALAAALEGGATSPTVLDVRWELATGPRPADYLDGHIPGAVFVDLDAELAGPPGAGGRHPLPEEGLFAGAMRAAGVANGRPVAVYDVATSIAAARAWWLLRYFGHPAVAVLDGGLKAWVDAGYPLTDGSTIPAAGDFVTVPGGMPLLGAGEAGALARTGTLIDARAPERFRGEQEPIDPVAGHIPGAVNRPTTENVDRSGRFRDPDDLRHGFEQLGIVADSELGVYCGSGVSAAHEVLALALAGYGAALYAGSWSEWITDRRRLVETGAASQG